MTEMSDRDMELLLLRRELEETKLQNAKMISQIDMLNEEIERLKDALDDCGYEEPADLEMGFDPYLGCYTDDC